MQEEFEILPSEEEIAMMNKEYKENGVGMQKCETHFFEYPIPIYMVDVCSRFCRCANAMVRIISMLDKVFIGRNKKTLEFVISGVTKNRIGVASMANVTQDNIVNIDRMPIKQSMYKLLELHNSMSIMLGDIGVYVKSVQMQDIVLRHLLVGSVLHGLCI